MIERFEVEQPASAAFPPREFWRYDPIADGPMDVIYDEHGFVDIDATVALVQSTMVPEYDWASEIADFHHIQHDFADYQSTPDGWVNEREFRNLPTRQILEGRRFHAWWHRVMNKPIKPDNPTAMEMTIDAVKPMVKMRQSYEYVFGTELREDQTRFNREDMEEFALRLGHFCDLLERLQSVPENFQLIDLSAESICDVQDMIRVTQMLAHFTRPRSPIPIHIVAQSEDSELIAA